GTSYHGENRGSAPVTVDAQAGNALARRATPWTTESRQRGKTGSRFIARARLDEAAGRTRVLFPIQREPANCDSRTFLCQSGENLPLASLSMLAPCLVANAQCCEYQWRPRQR